MYELRENTQMLTRTTCITNTLDCQTSFCGMKYLQNKIYYVTQYSTPLGISSHYWFTGICHLLLVA